MKLSDLSYTKLSILSDHWLEKPEDRAAIAASFEDQQVTIERYLQFFRHFESKRAELDTEALLAMFSNTPQDQPPATVEAILDEAASVPQYPPSPSPEWNEYLEIDCDNAIIIADVELPDYDEQLMRAAHAVAVHHGIKTLIIGGDYTALDSVSDWKKVYQRQGAVGLLQELQMASRVLDTALTWFDRVYAIMGNHEWRLGRALNGQLGPYDVIKTLNGEVRVEPYDFMYLNTSRGRVMVVHPSNYSRKQLHVPQDILNTEEPRCHIMSTHTHHSASGMDASGHYELMEIGCLRAPLKTQYKSQRRTTHPQWTQGFAVIKDGFRHRLTKHDTDWRMWLGDALYNDVFGKVVLGVAA